MVVGDGEEKKRDVVESRKNNVVESGEKERSTQSEKREFGLGGKRLAGNRVLMTRS